MAREEVIQMLRRTLGQVSHESSDRLYRVAAQIRDAKDSVIARYRPMFSPENIDGLSQEDFRGFLLFRNNQHWDGLHRQVGSMTADMPKLRQAIKLLVDEDLDIRTRLNRLRPTGDEPMVKGLGRAVITAILQVVHPDKYGVWNNTAQGSMRQLGLWPEFQWGASFGEKYEAVNQVLLEVAEELGTDLWTLDMLWWRVTPHMPLGAQAVAGEEPPTDEEGGEGEEAGAAAEGGFGLERHLHEFLVDNWDRTELGRDWQLLEEDGEIVGSRYNTGEDVLTLTGQLDDAQGLGPITQGAGHGRGVSATGIVLVGQDRHPPGVKGRVVRELRPVARAHRVGGRDQTQAGETVGVFLSLDDEDPVGRVGGQQLRQAVQDAGHAVHVPRPAAAAVWSSLAEVLRVQADDLVEQLAGGVAVVVGGDDPAGGRAAVVRGGQRAHGQAERAADGHRRAASMAVQQDAVVLPAGDTEAGVAVVVRRAAGLPLSRAGLLGDLQAPEDVLDRVVHGWLRFRTWLRSQSSAACRSRIGPAEATMALAKRIVRSGSSA